MNLFHFKKRKIKIKIKIKIGIEIKELNEAMKKLGPTLKVASVILQVISISAKFAGIPFPDIGGVIDQVVEYSEKAQEIFGNCEMKIESLKEMTKEDIIKRMNQNGTSELKLQPLEGDIIGTFKNDMFGESQVFLSFFFFFFLFEDHFFHS